MRPAQRPQLLRPRPPVNNDITMYACIRSPFAERHFDGWAAAVEQHQQLPYRHLLPGHGRPGGRELYDHVLEYLAFAEPALKNAHSGEQLKQALVAHFPKYEGILLIDLQNSLYLFPPQPALAGQ